MRMEPIAHPRLRRNLRTREHPPRLALLLQVLVKALAGTCIDLHYVSVCLGAIAYSLATVRICIGRWSCRTHKLRDARLWALQVGLGNFVTPYEEHEDNSLRSRPMEKLRLRSS